jgi:hypothetical protein
MASGPHPLQPFGNKPVLHWWPRTTVLVNYPALLSISTGALASSFYGNGPHLHLLHLPQHWPSTIAPPAQHWPLPPTPIQLSPICFSLFLWSPHPFTPLLCPQHPPHLCPPHPLPLSSAGTSPTNPNPLAPSPTNPTSLRHFQPRDPHSLAPSHTSPSPLPLHLLTPSLAPSLAGPVPLLYPQTSYS